MKNLSVAMALAVIAGSAVPIGLDARAQTGPTTASADDDVPPFIPSRGPDQPLSLAVAGLASGAAEVGSGRRVFAVCWQGGAAPYHLVLRDAAQNILVRESNLGANKELVEASKPMDFAPGVYQIEVSDDRGGRAAGQFTVVAPARVPAPPTPAHDPQGVVVARAIAQTGVAFAYEAYLRVIAAAVGVQGSPADQLARDLCHRPASTSPPG